MIRLAELAHCDGKGCIFKESSKLWILYEYHWNFSDLPKNDL